jgi:peptidoglycan/xylan/chitin deacetylase (PgdA/CDA1 family)
MRWLNDRYDVVTLRDFVERMAAGASMRSLAAITFDDGYSGVFEHAVPVLRALNLPATVFVVADAAGGETGFWWDQPAIVAANTPARRQSWLTDLRGDGRVILAAAAADGDLPASHKPAGWPVIRAALAKGIDIGAHSMTHRSLPRLTDTELEHEIVTSRQILYRQTGVSPAFFAYPYGHADSRVPPILRSAGYRGAFTLRAGLNRSLADPWQLSRVNVPAQISDGAFEAWAAGLSAFRRH